MTHTRHELNPSRYEARQLAFAHPIPIQTDERTIIREQGCQVLAKHRGANTDCFLKLFNIGISKLAKVQLSGLTFLRDLVDVEVHEDLIRLLVVAIGLKAVS